MIEAEFTYFDLTILGIMTLSCLFAFFRGFVKEILSLGAWIGAGIVTLYFFRDVAELIKPHVKSDMVSGGLAALGLYVISLLTFSLFNSMIMRMMKEGGDIGLLDNTLGLLFGALRGAFIISLGYFLLMTVMTKDNAPDWLKTAHTAPYAEQGAIILGKAAPDYLVELTSLKDNILEGKEGGKVNFGDMFGSSDTTSDQVDIKRDDEKLDDFIHRLEKE